MKTCIRCQEPKPDDDFGTHGRDKKTGEYRRDLFCKACLNAQKRAKFANDPAAKERKRWNAQREREKHRDAILEKQRARARLHPEKIREAVARSRERHPDRVAARQATAAAIDRGELVRQPCGICGAEPTQAHHHRGYAPEHWFDVIWLCRAHHYEAHRKLSPPPPVDVTESWRTRQRYTDAELIERLQVIARETGRTPRFTDCPTNIFMKHFGSWNKALAAAGLADRSHMGMPPRRKEASNL